MKAMKARDLSIPEPCGESWEGMQPRGEGRFCDRCQHVVVDLTRLSQRQVEARLSRARGDYLCVQLEVDARGDTVFAPGRSPVRHAAGSVFLAVALGAGGCSREEPAPPAEIAALEGECMLPAGGPPMLPVDPESLASGDPLTTGPVHVEPSLEDGTPTAEQAALTSAKHRPVVTPIHHSHMIRGRMPLRQR